MGSAQENELGGGFENRPGKSLKAGDIHLLSPRFGVDLCGGEDLIDVEVFAFAQSHQGIAEGLASHVEGGTNDGAEVVEGHVIGQLIRRQGAEGDDAAGSIGQ